MDSTIAPCILDITWAEYQKAIKSGYPYRGLGDSPAELAPTMTELLGQDPTWIYEEIKERV